MAKDSSKTKRWEKIKAGLKTAGKIFVYCAVPTLLIAGLVASAILCPPAFVGILVGLIAWGAILHHRDRRKQEKTFARASRNIDFDPREGDGERERRSASYFVLASTPPPSLTVGSDGPPKDASSPLAEKQQLISSSNVANARNTLNT